MQFGSVKPGKDKIAVPDSTTGRNAPEEWPDACRMLTDEEVESVFPRAPVESRSVPVQVLSSSREAPRGSCEFELSLSGTNVDDHVLLSLGTEDLAASEFVTTAFDNRKMEHRDRVDYGAKLGAEDCYALPAESSSPRETPTLNCRQGPVAFSLDASNSERVNIQANGDKAKAKVLFDRALKQFPKAIAGKFPPASRP